MSKPRFISLGLPTFRAKILRQRKKRSEIGVATRLVATSFLLIATTLYHVHVSIPPGNSGDLI